MVKGASRRGGAKVDFNQELYSQLSATEVSSPEVDGYQFPEWDVLREIDRRMRRSARDKVRGARIREYIRTHPDEVSRIKQKAGL